MTMLQDFPYFPIEFTKDGTVHQPTAVSALLAFLKQQPDTDLLVVAHGWNNDMQEAAELYDRLLGAIRQLVDTKAIPNLGTRRFAVLGVLWPSKKFAEEKLIASGAASGGSAIPDALLTSELDRLRGVFDAPDADERLAEAKKLVPRLEDSQTARTAFADLLRAVVAGAETSPDMDAAAKFKTAPGKELFENMSRPLASALLPSFEPKTSGSTGKVAGLGQFFGGVKAGALNLLNYTTYYQMKERAGKVGTVGLHAVLVQARQAAPNVKLHLMGHSFGGRLVTAATNAGAQVGFRINTLTLLQAAFSHYGLSNSYDGVNPGFFRPLVTSKAVSGPIVITHSIKDTAVGKMYPLASLVARQVANALGDENDKYGGMGRNGALKTPEASESTMLSLGAVYSFQPGRIYNLNADAIIQDHSDITHAEVASAILQSIATT